MIVRIAVSAVATVLVLTAASVQPVSAAERRTPAASQSQQPQGVPTRRSGPAIGGQSGVAPMLQQGADTPGRPATQTNPNVISTQPIGRNVTPGFTSPSGTAPMSQPGTAATTQPTRQTSPGRVATQPIGRSSGPQRPARRE